MVARNSWEERISFRGLRYLEGGSLLFSSSVTVLGDGGPISARDSYRCRPGLKSRYDLLFSRHKYTKAVTRRRSASQAS